MSKKDKKQLQYLDRSLVISPIYYALCTSEKAYKKEMKRLGISKNDTPSFIKNEWSHATVHHLDNKGKSISLVCIDKKQCEKDNRTPNEICGLLIHEAVHIWQEIKENIGEYEPSAEFEAYSIQCIAKRLIEAY
jgi:hypothetical protein